MREAQNRGQQLGLNEDEIAFYDALETNDSAVKVLGDDTLRTIARELVETVRKNTTIDWSIRENVRANMRVLVKRILRKYGYPPDKQERATLTVLEQAEVLSVNWAKATVEIYNNVPLIQMWGFGAPAVASRRLRVWAGQNLEWLVGNLVQIMKEEADSVTDAAETTTRLEGVLRQGLPLKEYLDKLLDDLASSDDKPGPSQKLS
jgi:Type I restriction enzyme HindI endonuclease subunit-like, C-terminal